jgi:hypothetical protein
MPTMSTNVSSNTERFFNNFATVRTILAGVLRWNGNRDHTKHFAQIFNRLLAEVREQGTGNREQKEELRLKASKTLYF